MDFKAIGSSGEVRNDVRMSADSFLVNAIASGQIAASACSGSHDIARHHLTSCGHSHIIAVVGR